MILANLRRADHQAGDAFYRTNPLAEADAAREAADEARDPYAYRGVRRSDFI